MDHILTRGPEADTHRQADAVGVAPLSNSDRVCFALIAGGAFGLYWLSSFILQARGATTHFGADSWYFYELAAGDVISRIAGNYYLDRITRFHPTTVIMAAAWMKIVNPLTEWISPLHLLKAMFAAVGALGVWAAMWAFAAVMQRRYVALFGVIYAVSFGVWYFASIEESKIVTATLSTLYIASYLHLRKNWTMRGAAVLTAILLVACLNEMVSGFLVIIPIVDTLLQRGWDWRHGAWIAVHALAGPVAFVIIEGVMYGRLVAVSHPEGTSHVGMLLFYISKNTYDLAALYSFVINWLCFNLAAPTADASYGIPASANYRGYFAPAFADYFSSWASAGLVAAIGVMIAACIQPRYRSKLSSHQRGILLALSAYILIRGTFFFVFNPGEPLLFSPAITLAHILVLAVPFAASDFPAKRALLAAVAALLLVTNGTFVVGR